MARTGAAGEGERVSAADLVDRTADGYVGYVYEDRRKKSWMVHDFEYDRDNGIVSAVMITPWHRLRICMTNSGMMIRRLEALVV